MTRSKSKSESPNLQNIPDDMLYEIASRLSIHDRMNTAKASKAFTMVNTNKAPEWYKDAYKYIMKKFFFDDMWRNQLEFVVHVPETADQGLFRVFPFKTSKSGTIVNLKLQILYNEIENKDSMHKMEVRVDAMMDSKIPNPMIQKVNGQMPDKEIPDVRTLFRYVYNYERPEKDTNDAGISAAELILKTLEIMGKVNEPVIVCGSVWKNKVKQIFTELMQHVGIDRIEERKYRQVPEYRLGNIPANAELVIVKAGPILPLSIYDWSTKKGFTLAGVPEFSYAFETKAEWETRQPYDLVFKIHGSQTSLAVRHMHDKARGDVVIWSLNNSRYVPENFKFFLQECKPLRDKLEIQGSPDTLIDDIVRYLNYQYSENAQLLGFVPMAGGQGRRKRINHSNIS